MKNYYPILPNLSRKVSKKSFLFKTKNIQSSSHLTVNFLLFFIFIIVFTLTFYKVPHFLCVKYLHYAQIKTPFLYFPSFKQILHLNDLLESY